MKHLPPIEDYMANAMMPETREEFDRFYEDNFNTEFFLDEKLAEYCCSDTGWDLLHKYACNLCLRYFNPCCRRLSYNFYGDFERRSLPSQFHHRVCVHALLANAVYETKPCGTYSSGRLRAL